MALVDRSTRLALISAWNDSGGGFLHRLMDGHSQLAAWPFELQLGNCAHHDAFSPLIADKYRWPAARNPAVRFFDSIADEELKSVLNRLESAKHRAFAVDVSINDWRRAFVSAADVDTRRGLIATYIDSFLTLWQGDASRPWIVAHCPSLVVDAGEILEDFADAKLLHVVRGPIAGIMDFRRRHPGFSITAYATRWSAVNEAAIRWRKTFPDSILIIDFAELCASREATMRRIANFLCLRFEGDLLVPGWQGQRLDESAMGPFGGVPQISTERDMHLHGLLSDDERDALLQATERTRLALGMS